MKTEINNENKSKFFSLYWGQKIMNNDYSTDNFINPLSVYVQMDDYLKLKPLSQISDEHIQFIKKICEYKSDLDVAGFVRTLEGKWFNRKNIPHYKVLLITDYLRSNGFALPWLNLSIDDMRDAGWIKLVGE